MSFFESTHWKNINDLKLPARAEAFAGVCQALGKATPIGAWIWRVAFMVVTLIWGVGIIAYIIMWICVPREQHAD